MSDGSRAAARVSSISCCAATAELVAILVFNRNWSIKSQRNARRLARHYLSDFTNTRRGNGLQVRRSYKAPSLRLRLLIESQERRELIIISLDLFHEA